MDAELHAAGARSEGMEVLFSRIYEQLRRGRGMDGGCTAPAGVVATGPVEKACECARKLFGCNVSSNSFANESCVEVITPGSGALLIWAAAAAVGSACGLDVSADKRRI